MADEVTSAPQAPVQTAAPQESAAPQTQAPVSAPSVETSSPAPSEVTPAQEAVAKPAATVLGGELENVEPKTDTPVEDNLAVEVKPAEEKAPEAPKDAKPVDADKPAEPPKEEVKPSDEPAPLPTYDFKLDEGLALDEKKFGDFTKQLAELEVLTKADHAKMQEFGQRLVEQHVADIQETLKRQNEHYVNLFEKQKNEWRDQFAADSEIGGNRQDTTVKAARKFIKTHGGTDVQQKEFRELMESTGIGNHPAMIRLLAKAAVAMSEGGPLPATKPESAGTKSKVERRYGKS